MQWNAREMDVMLKYIVLLSLVFNCDGVSEHEQLARIARRFDNREGSVILGAPSYPSHLPEAEPILPGHTLIRPALGMLKSAVKFPHKELDNGAGVYGNINNLGLRYDSRDERLMYSGFRRTPIDYIVVNPLSDLSSEETLRQNRDQIRKLVKIFPAKPITKKTLTPPPNWHKKKQNLILFTPNVGDKNRKNELKRKISINAKFDKSNKKDRSNIRVLSRHDDGYDSSNTEIKRSMDSRLHSSIKTLLFAKKLLQRLRSKNLYQPNKQRRQRDVIIIKTESPNIDGGDLDKSSEENQNSENIDRKHKLLYQGKNVFNHIKFNSDAPEHEEYLPADIAKGVNDIRNWWYYHQADFKPFGNQEND